MVFSITNDENGAIQIDDDGRQQNRSAQKNKNSNGFWEPSQTSVAAMEKIRDQETLDHPTEYDPNCC